MPIYKINTNKLDPISEKKIDLEKDIQSLTEQNLETVFGFEFIRSEFQMNSLRIDTLAWNKESQSFIIIEYKKDRSFSVIDQGYAYLALMLNNKADFILEYNEKMKNNLKRDDVDWSQSRVIFVANSFTSYQQSAINFKDLPIELWEAKKYQNDLILYNQLKCPDSSESIKTISKNKTVNEVSNEVKNYTIDDHFKENWKESRELFDQLNEKILSRYSEVRQTPVKTFIGYKIGQKNLICIWGLKSGPWIEFTRSQPKDFNDPDKRVKYNENSMKHYNQHTSGFLVKNSDDVDYAMSLINQSYNRMTRD